MFKNDSQGSLYYESKNGLKYSLLLGTTNNGLSSDIIFIFREATIDQLENGFCGKVVTFIYGGFRDLNAIEEEIRKYEKELNL